MSLPICVSLNCPLKQYKINWLCLPILRVDAACPLLNTPMRSSPCLCREMRVTQQEIETDRFICVREVSHLIGLKNSALYQMIRRGSFPKPVKLGGASRWSLNAVLAWMSARLQEAA